MQRWWGGGRQPWASTWGGYPSGGVRRRRKPSGTETGPSTPSRCQLFRKRIGQEEVSGEMQVAPCVTRRPSTASFVQAQASVTQAASCWPWERAWWGQQATRATYPAAPLAVLPSPVPLRGTISPLRLQLSHVCGWGSPWWCSLLVVPASRTQPRKGRRNRNHGWAALPTSRGWGKADRLLCTNRVLLLPVLFTRSSLAASCLLLRY